MDIEPLVSHWDSSGALREHFLLFKEIFDKKLDHGEITSAYTTITVWAGRELAGTLNRDPSFNEYCEKLHWYLIEENRDRLIKMVGCALPSSAREKIKLQTQSL